MGTKPTKGLTMDSPEKSPGRLMIISNRLPFVIGKKEDKLTISPGSGGLVTALAPVLRDRGGLWVGWPGPVEAEEAELVEFLEKKQRTGGFLCAPVHLTKEEISLYYDGFSNEIIWPLFHDLQSLCHFVPAYWQGYQQASSKFAAVIMKKIQSDDFVWVHDYHLMLLGQELRKNGATQRMGFFLHIPFPPLDIFLKLPWRFQIIHALLEFDLIGFQTMRDRRNFIQCVRTLIKDVQVKNKGAMHICKLGQREVGVGTFPISIDDNEFKKMAASKAVSEEIQSLREISLEQKRIFSVDRLDYTKGIPERLEAIRFFLKQYPEFHKKVTFLQVLVPSRVEIPQYHDLKEEVDRLVGEINSHYTQEGWVPIHHLFRTLNRQELVAYYKVSEIALITPIKDGMNLVAKEYVACNIEENGVLILSEFAGAASQLHCEALLINPYDTAGMADTIRYALTMSSEERKMRMRKMRRNVRHYNIFWWVESFLSAAISKELKDFPPIEYIPADDVVESDLFSYQGF